MLRADVGSRGDVWQRLSAVWVNTMQCTGGIYGHVYRTVYILGTFTLKARLRVHNVSGKVNTQRLVLGLHHVSVQSMLSALLGALSRLCTVYTQRSS